MFLDHSLVPTTEQQRPKLQTVIQNQHKEMTDDQEATALRYVLTHRLVLYSSQSTWLSTKHKIDKPT